MNKKRSLRIGFIVIIFIAVLAKPIYTIINDRKISSNISLVQYNNLFINDAQHKLKIIVTVTSSDKEPESDYVFDGKFDVFVYRVIISPNIDFKHIVSIQDGDSEMSNEEVYSRLPSYNFKMSKRSGDISNVKIVNIKINGNHLSNIRMDSISSYYFEFNQFGINYNKGPYDIVAKADNSNIPMNILFKKKDNFLYVIIMTIKTEKVLMSPTELYDIINK